MTAIPKQTKYIVSGISFLIFLALNFGVGYITLFGLAPTIQEATHYFFGITTSAIDYAVIASFPIFGMLLSVKRSKTDYLSIMAGTLLISIFALITFCISLPILTVVGKLDNPLIPEYLLAEPFGLYSVFWIGIGILFPFLLFRNNKQAAIEIDEIGNTKE